MRKIILFLFLAVYNVICFSQVVNESVPDCEFFWDELSFVDTIYNKGLLVRYEVNAGGANCGKIICEYTLEDKLQKTTEYKNGQMTEYQLYSYSPDGYVCETRDFKDYLIDKYKVHLNEKKQCDEMTFYDSLSDFSGNVKNTYDDSGNKILQISCKKDYSIEQIYRVVIGKNGLIKEKMFINKENIIISKTVFEYDSDKKVLKSIDSSYNYFYKKMLPSYISKYVYDKSGREIFDSTFAYINHKLNFQDVLITKYNIDGRVESQSWAKENKISYKYEYLYNNVGQLIIKKTYGDNDKLKNETTFEYDKYGNKIKSTEKDAKGKLKKEWLWTYQY